jgi:hypothetical protein
MKHEWWVISTEMEEGYLILSCGKTDATGTVRDPNLAEWRKAFYAPSKPYRWHDESRVVIDDDDVIALSA